MFRLTLFVCSFVVALMLFSYGCSKERVSFDTAEDARRQIRENVTVQAQSFRAENKMADFDIMVRGDSTVALDCPQGDGWASVDFRNAQTGQVLKLKCSTVSLGIGCLLEEDFKNRPYANEEGRCNPEIPFPLPKLSR